MVLYSFHGRFARFPPQAIGWGGRTALIAGILPALQSREKDKSMKHASELATRLSIPAGATLAATYLLALVLTSHVF